jgi:hypothetical protein
MREGNGRAVGDEGAPSLRNHTRFGRQLMALLKTREDRRRAGTSLPVVPCW